MGLNSGIAWTDATWNPWQGCDKVSAGCKNCYMYREKNRYGQDPMTVIKSKPSTFNAPLTWAKNGKLPAGSRIFVCSWSDFFHEDADPWRQEAWKIIEQLPQYDFLIPTKRTERIIDCLPYFEDGTGFMPDNVWLGASVENQEMFDKRIEDLLEAPAKIHWLSVEPMLGPIDFHFPPYLNDGTDTWIVLGGESGPGCRPCDSEWIRDAVEQCMEVQIPVFVKQLGGWPDTRSNMEDFPEDLRIREFPE